MKNFTVSVVALAAGLSMSVPTFAQSAFARLDGESALQMASRIGACDGSGIETARFSEAGSVLNVRCVGGVGGTDLSGGLGTGAIVAGGVALVAIAAAASGSSSGTSSTTGTN